MEPTVEPVHRRKQGCLFGEGSSATPKVRDMQAWGMEEYLRVTVGTEEENEKFIEALKNIK